MSEFVGGYHWRAASLASALTRFGRSLGSQEKLTLDASSFRWIEFLDVTSRGNQFLASIHFLYWGDLTNSA